MTIKERISDFMEFNEYMFLKEAQYYHEIDKMSFIKALKCGFKKYGFDKTDLHMG